MDLIVPPAAADCELIRSEWWGQPINSATTAAFLIAGVVVYWQTRRVWAATALALTGVGSFLFHGPMPMGSEWAHDVSLAWLIVVIGVAGTPFERFGTWPALAGLAVLFGALPATADPIAVVLTAGAVVVIIRQQTAPTGWALLLLTAGAIVGRLSATGGPWCRPESWLQGHGLWHLAAAASLVVISLDQAQLRSKSTPPKP
jgi:hypothetical protein